VTKTIFNLDPSTKVVGQLTLLNYETLVLVVVIVL